MAEQQNREENSPANKFGHFKVQLGSLLNRKIVLEIAALWNYPRGAVEKLENAHDAGREMVAVMEERAEITPEGISRLKRALVECNYDGVAQEMQQAFNNIHFGLTRLNVIQQKNKEHCSGLVNLLYASQVTEETLENETTVAIDVTGVTELIEKHKETHRVLLGQERAAVEAIDTTETFLHDHYAPLPANELNKTREIIRELRKKFDHLNELSAQRQSQLANLLIKATEEVEKQIQNQNDLHCNELETLLQSSKSLERRLGNTTIGAADVRGATQLIEEHKGIHRELLERKRAAMDAIQTTETFLREHHAPLPANNQHETRDMIRELRNTFDYLLEWSAQRQSQLTDLLIKAEEGAQQQIHQIQDKTGEQCAELEKLVQSSQVIEGKLQNSPFSISQTDIAQVEELIEKNKEIHRDMSEQRRIALHAVETRYKFDHLLELSAQRQSKLTELLSRTKEEARKAEVVMERMERRMERASALIRERREILPGWLWVREPSQKK